MSSNLASLNTIPDRLSIKLVNDNTSVTIDSNWYYDYPTNQIRFKYLSELLTYNNYTLHIYNIITPSIIKQDLLTLCYIRVYDMTYTIYNNIQATDMFPPVSQPTYSTITIVPYFNT